MVKFALMMWIYAGVFNTPLQVGPIYFDSLKECHETTLRLAENFGRQYDWEDGFDLRASCEEVHLGQ